MAKRLEKFDLTESVTRALASRIQREISHWPLAQPVAVSFEESFDAVFVVLTLASGMRVSVRVLRESLASANFPFQLLFADLKKSLESQLLTHAKYRVVERARGREDEILWEGPFPGGYYGELGVVGADNIIQMKNVMQVCSVESPYWTDMPPPAKDSSSGGSISPRQLQEAPELEDPPWVEDKTGAVLSPQFLTPPPDAIRRRAPVRGDDSDVEGSRLHALAAAEHKARTRAALNPEIARRENETLEAARIRVAQERAVQDREFRAEELQRKRAQAIEKERLERERLETAIREGAQASWRKMHHLLAEVEKLWGAAAVAEASAHAQAMEEELFGTGGSVIEREALWMEARSCSQRMILFMQRRLAEVQARIDGLSVSAAFEDVEDHEAIEEAGYISEEEAPQQEFDTEEEIEQQRRVVS